MIIVFIFESKANKFGIMNCKDGSVLTIIPPIFLAYTTILLGYIGLGAFTTTSDHGWLIRYAHSNCATFYFILLYMHMARAIYYSS